VGAQETTRERLRPAARLTGPEKPLKEKDDPARETPEMLTLELPVLLSRSVCEEDAPTSTLPKAMLAMLGYSK